MSLSSRFTVAALGLALCLPLATHAHDLWMLPSSTVLSGNSGWVTVDAAVGNDKFYFNHAPMRLDGLTVIAPDGSQAEAENMNRGKLRSTFDLQMKTSGTYRIALVNDGVFAHWKENGKNKRYFGKVDSLAAAIPASAQELEVTQSVSRVETFVTVGKPTPVQAAGKGLELVPVTQPNDLVSGETATFEMRIDGQPAVALEVTLVPGGSRYRDKVDEIKVETGGGGKFQVKWPQPGFYWVHAAHEDGRTTVERAKKRRLSYSGTLEVLAP